MRKGAFISHLFNSLCLKQSRGSPKSIKDYGSMRFEHYWSNDLDMWNKGSLPPDDTINYHSIPLSREEKHCILAAGSPVLDQRSCSLLALVQSRVPLPARRLAHPRVPGQLHRHRYICFFRGKREKSWMPSGN